MELPQPGLIYIGRKARRGVKGSRNATRPGVLNIDVTSGSAKKINGYKCKELSPMFIGPVIDRSDNLEFKVMENFWQFQKLWCQAGHLADLETCRPSKKWYEFRAKGAKLERGKRSPAPKKKYGPPYCARYHGKSYFEVVSARKEAYVPTYKQLIKQQPVFWALLDLVLSGQSIMIIDVDVPEGPEGHLMTQEFYKTAIGNCCCPFGHGFVVAMTLLEELKKSKSSRTSTSTKPTRRAETVPKIKPRPVVRFRSHN